MRHFERSKNRMNLYRIMADVRAGAGQRVTRSGDRGIATLWVRAESESIALARGKLVLANRHYSSLGTLHSFAEELADDPLASATAEERAAERREHAVVADYDAVKEQALAQGDGLHELWLGELGHQFAQQRVS